MGVCQKEGKGWWDAQNNNKITIKFLIHHAKLKYQHAIYNKRHPSWKMITPEESPNIQPCNFPPADCQSKLFTMVTLNNKNEWNNN